MQYPGPPTLIGPMESAEDRVPSTRGAASNRPATSPRSEGEGGGCGATGAPSGTYTSQPDGGLAYVFVAFFDALLLPGASILKC